MCHFDFHYKCQSVVHMALTFQLWTTCKFGQHANHPYVCGSQHYMQIESEIQLTSSSMIEQESNVLFEEVFTLPHVFCTDPRGLCEESARTFDPQNGRDSCYFSPRGLTQIRTE